MFWVFMQVEIWSDVVCPWCYLGKRRFERALALRDALVVKARSIPAYRYNLAHSCVDVSNVDRQIKRFKQGEAQIRRAVAILEGLIGEEPGSVLYQTGLARALNHLGLLLTEDARPAETRHAEGASAPEASAARGKAHTAASGKAAAVAAKAAGQSVPAEVTQDHAGEKAHG